MSYERATSQPTDGMESDRLNRLIGGRRRHNRLRAVLAQQRRGEVARLMSQFDIRKRGWQAEVARQLGVHRGTVCRDFAAMLADCRRLQQERDGRAVERRQLFMHLLARCEDPELFEVPR